MTNKAESTHYVIFSTFLTLLLFPVETFPSTRVLTRALLRRIGADWWFRNLRDGCRSYEIFVFLLRTNRGRKGDISREQHKEG